MNDLKKIYQRLQANYPEGDWEIALEGERLSIRLERAQVVVEGGRAVFTEEEEPAQELPVGISQQELLEQVHQAVNAALEEAGWGDPMGVIAGYFFQKKLEYRALGRLLCEKKTAGGKAG